MQILKIPKQVCILGRVVLCFKGLLPPLSEPPVAQQISSTSFAPLMPR